MHAIFLDQFGGYGSGQMRAIEEALKQFWKGKPVRTRFHEQFELIREEE
jgi:hypothetical protein